MKKKTGPVSKLVVFAAFAALAFALLPPPAAAQPFDAKYLSGLRWRSIGPYRGRPDPGRGRRPEPAERLLHRRLQRRRVEVDRLRPALGSRSSTTSRPARSGPSPSLPPIRTPSMSSSGEGLQRPDLSVGDGDLPLDGRRQDLDAPRPPRRPADPADHRRPARTATGSSSPSSAIPTARTPSGASSARPTAGRPSRRSSTRTRTPAGPSWPSIPRIPTSSMPGSGNRARGRGRTRPGAAPAAVCSSPSTAARPGNSSSPPARTASSRSTSAVAPSEPRRALRRHRHGPGHGDVSLRRRRRDLGPAPGRPPGLPHRRRATCPGRPSIPSNPDIVIVASHGVLEIDRRRQDLRRLQGRARRRRLPEPLDQPDEPGHHPLRHRPGRALSRSTAARPGAPGTTSRRPSSTTSRPTTPFPTASTAASRRAARSASPAGATTAGSPSANGSPSASTSTATPRPIRSTPTSSTAAGASPASTGGRARSRRSGPTSAAAATSGRCGPSPSSSRRPTRMSSFTPRTRSGGRPTAARAGDQISPDLTRKTWDVPASVGKYKAEASAQPSQRGVIYTIGPSPLDVEPDLDRDRRRADPRDGGRRQDVDGRHAARTRPLGQGLHHRRRAASTSGRPTPPSIPSASTTCGRTSTGRTTAARPGRTSPPASPTARR